MKLSVVVVVVVAMYSGTLNPTNQPVQVALLLLSAFIITYLLLRVVSFTRELYVIYFFIRHWDVSGSENRVPFIYVCV